MSELQGKGIGMLLAIHGAIRRDLARLAQAVGVLADPNVSAADRAAGAAGLASYWTCFAQQLHHHHVIEDREIWPYLRGALGARSGQVLDAMEAEHGAIDAAQASAQKAVDVLRGDPTVGV